MEERQKKREFTMIGKRFFVSMAAVALAVTAASAQGPRMTSIMVYKSPTCGCCGKWIEHLKASGFAVTVQDVPDLAPVRLRYGVLPRFSSCHTAVVEGYTVEGHVPADVIRKLLKEKPNVAGLAVSGMPVGAPGMEGPNPRPYDVLAFDASGNTTVYASR